MSTEYTESCEYTVQYVVQYVNNESERGSGTYSRCTSPHILYRSSVRRKRSKTRVPSIRACGSQYFLLKTAATTRSASRNPNRNPSAGPRISHRMLRGSVDTRFEMIVEKPNGVRNRTAILRECTVHVL